MSPFIVKDHLPLFVSCGLIRKISFESIRLENNYTMVTTTLIAIDERGALGSIETGRPRSAASTAAILAATRDLLEAGYERLTIDAIASRARVGKQTIYRWWPSKGAVVAEAAIEGMVTFSHLPVPYSGAVRPDLVDWVSRALAGLNDPRQRALSLALTAAAAGDPGKNSQIYEKFTEPTRTELISRLQAAELVGEIPGGADIPTAVDVILAVLTIVPFAHARSRQVDAESLVGLVISGLKGPPHSTE